MIATCPDCNGPAYPMAGGDGFVKCSACVEQWQQHPAANPGCVVCGGGAWLNSDPLSPVCPCVADPAPSW